MPKRTPESESAINFLLDKIKKRNLNCFKIFELKRLCTTLRNWDCVYWVLSFIKGITKLIKYDDIITQMSICVTHMMTSVTRITIIIFLIVAASALSGTKVLMVMSCLSYAFAFGYCILIHIFKSLNVKFLAAILFATCKYKHCLVQMFLNPALTHEVKIAMIHKMFFTRTNIYTALKSWNKLWQNINFKTIKRNGLDNFFWIRNNFWRTLSEKLAIAWRHLF